MKERPILFSAPMVRAILAGTKTQTRRVVNLPADAKHVCYWAPPSGRSESGYADPGVNYWTPDPAGETDSNHLNPCPYGQPGDRLWVREAFMHEPADYCWEASVSIPCRPASTVYRADYPESKPGEGWKPSIHMPRHLSRILLEVTSVRVERLQDISEADAVAEGVDFAGHTDEIMHDYSPDERFSMLWESINGAGSWNENPWVWVIEFRRVEV
jgi:hypothetical protein